MAAIAFYSSVFGARQKAYMPSFDALPVMHCELEINGGSVMLADAFPEFGQTRTPLPGELATASGGGEGEGGRSGDEGCAKAASRGARAESNPMSSVWGTRLATVRD